MFDYRVRSAHPGDLEQISNLISNGSFVHRHLDWRTPLEWIGFHPYLVIEKKGRIRSVLACPPDPPLIGWVRLFASDGDISAQLAWNLLWENLLQVVEKKQDSKIAAIVLQNRFNEILTHSGFTCSQEIVMLNWMGKDLKLESPPDRFKIRDMVESDLPQVAELDAIAFDPLWQNTFFALQKAFHQAALATVVEEDGIIAGYQVTTRNLLGGHLARLAVHPSLQGEGMGYLLVTDMIQKLSRTDAINITVNTQSDNLTSLSLYRRIGFRETGERFPVFTYELNVHL